MILTIMEWLGSVIDGIVHFLVKCVHFLVKCVCWSWRHNWTYVVSNTDEGRQPIYLYKCMRCGLKTYERASTSNDDVTAYDLE